MEIVYYSGEKQTWKAQFAQVRRSAIKSLFFLMQCAYNLVPSNLNGMILVIALKQQKQLFHVKSTMQSEVTSQVHLCRKVVHSDSLETMECMRTDCVIQLI